MSEIYKKSNVRGIRGATTIESNKSELIKEATKELLEKWFKIIIFLLKI